MTVIEIEKVATAYLSKTKKWTAGEFRLDARPSTPKDHLIAAVYLKDGSYPDAGQSVLLRISKSSHEVVGEMGFQ